MGKSWCGWVVAVATMTLPSLALADRDDRAQEIVAQAQRSLDSGGDVADARRLVQRLITQRSFQALSPQNQQGAILALAKIAARDPGCDAALPAALAATEAIDAEERQWAAWLAQLYACDDYAGAAAALTTIIARFPRVVAGLGDAEIFRLVPYVDDPTALSFLLGEGWIHDDTLDISAIRLRLIRRLLADNRTTEAITVAQAMVANGRTDLGSIVEFLSDKVFDPIVAAAPTIFAFEAISDQQLANSLSDAMAAPERLSLVNALAQNLWDRQRFDEAKAITDDALARAREGTARRPTFIDLRESLNWTLDLHANILAAYGRTDEALDSMREGAEEPEGNRMNVSQTLNHIGMLLYAGQPQDAIDSLNQFDLRRASPYGRGVARRLRVCALAALDNEPAMRAALNDLVVHRRDSLIQTRVAAICAHDLDLAARTFLEQMNHPQERRNALISIQRFFNSDPTQGELGEILARPEVAAAIANEAHIQTFPISQPF